MPEPTLEEILAGAEQRIAAESPQGGSLEDILAGAEQRLAQEQPAPSRVITLPTQQIEGQVPPADDWSSLGQYGNAVNQFARGATLGAAPYLEAGWRRLTQGGDYGQHLADIRGGLAEGEERYPVSSLVAQGAGGAATSAAGLAALPVRAATAVPATAWTGVGERAALGAAEGATTAGFESGGDATKIAQGAVLGGTLAGRGAGLAQTAAKRQAQKSAEAAARRAAEVNPPPVMESLELGARKAAKAIGDKVMPVAGVAGASQMLGIPWQTGAKIGLAGVMAPYAMRGARAAGRGTGALADAALEKAGAQLAPAGAQQLASQTERYDPRALEVVRQRRATEQRNTGIDRVRQAFVDQSMSEPLRALVGSAIEEGADYKRMAAKLEEAQADPTLAAELSKLLGAKKGTSNEQ